MDEQPVFVSGLYRSGTTLLTLILDQSKELKMSYDTIHYLRFIHGKHSVNKNSVKHILDDINTRIIKRWNLKLDLDEILNKIITKNSFNHATLYCEIMRSFLKLSKEVRWGDKTNVCWESIPDFLKMFPRGKVIHIYRDPRDVLASYKKFTNNPSNMYLDAVFASSAMFNYLNLQENPSNVFILKYEDLVSAPEIYVKNICNFLNLQFTNEMLMCRNFRQKDGNYFDSNSVFSGRRNTIDSNSVGIWKKELSNLEIYLTELINSDKMPVFGYKPQNVRLNNSELKQFDDLITSEYLSPRYQYWLNYKTGLQAYPNDNLYNQHIN